MRVELVFLGRVGLGVSLGDVPSGQVSSHGGYCPGALLTNKNGFVKFIILAYLEIKQK